MINLEEISLKFFLQTNLISLNFTKWVREQVYNYNVCICMHICNYLTKSVIQIENYTGICFCFYLIEWN